MRAVRGVALSGVALVILRGCEDTLERIWSIAKAIIWGCALLLRVEFCMGDDPFAISIAI